jgi:hypothetical protein
MAGFSARYAFEEDEESEEQVLYADLTLSPEDYQFEPGYWEEQIPTGPLQGDVPTFPSLSTVAILD